MVGHVPYKLKHIFTDTMWSIAGLTLMNVAAQFVVYPYWNRVLGTEAYGNIVYLLAIMNVMAISVGSGINYTRMRKTAGGQTANKPYNLLMIGGNIASLLVLFLLKAVGIIKIGTTDFILFCVLTVITMWRHYADVEYRLKINYKGFFQYYFIIGVGYLAGVLLFKITRLWPFALLIGEIAGLLLVLIKGSILIDNKTINVIDSNDQFGPVFDMALILVGTTFLSHLILNGDRIILQLFSGSTAVTFYYISSLFGKTMTLVTTPLNGVLVGHLAKYTGPLTNKLMHQATAASLLAIVLATVVCTYMSFWILPFLYPTEFEPVKKYLVLANAAQIIFFVGNVLMASILLRFTAERNQIIINVTHGILFLALCIPITGRFGIEGFCWSLLFCNVARFVLCIFFGYQSAERGLL